MLNKLSKSWISFKLVFSKPLYLFTAILIAFLFYSFNAIISQYQFINILEIKELYLSLIGFKYFTTISSYYTTILISILTGILFSLILFKTINLNNSNSTNAISSVGIFLGALVPGCAACGVGLISIIGLSAAVVSLPFKGLEISILAIAIISWAIFYTAITLLECKKIKRKI